MILKIKRLIATFIDYLLIFYICYIPTYFIYSLFETMLLNILSGTIAILLFINIFLRKDYLIGFESIGKKIMRLKIYQNGKTIKNSKVLKERVLYSLKWFNLYPFMILINNKSLGDKKLNTEVK